jgi:hypothetical protein
LANVRANPVTAARMLFDVRQHQAVHRLLHRNGRDVEDAPPAALFHPGQHRAREVDHAVEILPHGIVPHLPRVILEGARRWAARVGDQDVDLAEVAEPVRHHPVQLLRIRQIGGHRNDIDTATFRDRQFRLVEVSCVPSTHDKRGALGAHFVRHRPPESFTRRRDQRDFAFESEIHWSSFSWK